jgi:hypothetical protein
MFYFPQGNNISCQADFFFFTKESTTTNFHKAGQYFVSSSMLKAHVGKNLVSWIINGSTNTID